MAKTNKNKFKLLCIIGARPQFIKHYPFEVEAKKFANVVTVHTGQHYDKNMSSVFFDELGMDRPDYMLKLGGGSHGEQTGNMMIEIEKIVITEKPNAVIVYGDTNSTLAGALVAAKLHIKLIHIEAGLRSYNKKMPEEINRVLTDHVADLLFVPSQKAIENLEKEGLYEGVYVVGDLMKDLIKLSIDRGAIKVPNVEFPYHYITLHRPYNVDEKDRLKYILENLSRLDKQLIFAIHPRTKKRMLDFGINISGLKNIHFIEPQPYFENLSYLLHSDGLITDSGGMQKEAYWLKKPCVTIRTETEWIETLDNHANVLLFDNLCNIEKVIKRNNISYKENLYGDGKSASNIVNLIIKNIGFEK